MTGKIGAFRFGSRLAALALFLPLQALPAQSSESIIVEGQRIEDYRAQLAACLARRCPTNEDVDVTLALAEALLVEGEYEEGRSEVLASLRRNRGQSRAFPEPMSDLHRARSVLARHIGRDDEALRASYGILDSLQDGIPAEDYRHFTARFEIAQTLMMMRNYRGAARELATLARHARAAGREDVAIMAELKSRWYAHIAWPHGPAVDELVEIAASNDPQQRLRATGAKVLLARIYRARGEEDRADALLTEIGRGNGDSERRRLLHSPTFQLATWDPTDVSPVEGDPGFSFSNTSRLPPNYRDRWIDVGFWVNPDGRVEGVEVVRQGAGAGWAAPLLNSIRGRIYSEAGHPSWRLERYTYTAGYEMPTGSRIQRRSADSRVEYFDLTEGTSPPPPTPAINIQ